MRKNRLYMGVEFEFLYNGKFAKFKKEVKKELSKWNISFKGNNSFDIKEDCSIDTNNTAYYWDGLELVTPVMPYSVGKTFTKSFLKFLSKSKNCRTNNSCGLHINLSFVKDELNFQIDRVRLMSAINEKTLLEKWNRSENEYTISNQSDLERIIKKGHKGSNVSIKNKMEDWLDENQDHQDAISFEKLEDATEWSGEDNPYVEFRIMGGKNYQYHWRKIQSTLTQYEKAMYWSVNEFYDRYVTKKINKVKKSKLSKYNTFIPH